MSSKNFLPAVVQCVYTLEISSSFFYHYAQYDNHTPSCQHVVLSSFLYFSFIHAHPILFIIHPNSITTLFLAALILVQQQHSSVYLKTQGINPDDHPIKQEIARIQLYFKKLKERSNKASSNDNRNDDDDDNHNSSTSSDNSNNSNSVHLNNNTTTANTSQQDSFPTTTTSSTTLPEGDNKKRKNKASDSSKRKKKK